MDESAPKNYFLRKLFTFASYTALVLLIGRNLTFLPRIPSLQRIGNNNDSIKKDISNIIEKQKGTYSVYVVNLTTNQELGINEKQIYAAGSVNKVAIVTTLYFLASKGRINLDEKITVQKNDIQNYGTGKIRYEGAGGIYSLQSLAKLALQQSDNTATYILANRISMPVIQKTVHDWGLSQTDMENNKTSLADTYLLFKKIYQKKVTSEALTQELMGFLTDTDFEDRIPVFLPKQATVYHKTGDVAGGIHDVGLIESGGEVFFVGVLSSNIPDEKKAKEIIGKIANIVYKREIESKL